MNLKALELPEESAKKLGIFHRKRMYNLLKNPLYKGYINYQETLYKGQHEAIVGEALWNQVQNILSNAERTL